MVKHLVLSIAASVMLIGVVLFCSNAQAASPTEDFKPYLEGIVDVITNPEYAGDDKKDLRREKVMEVAKQAFDFTTMSKLVLGKTYRTLTAEQRAYFEELFTKLLENAYVGKLEGYTEQVTKYEGERVKGEKAEVITLVENKGVVIPVSYIMLTTDTGWKVYDIKIEGVRLLRNYKAQFKSILRKENFEGLVRTLEEKNASFGKDGSS